MRYCSICLCTVNRKKGYFEILGGEIYCIPCNEIDDNAKAGRKFIDYQHNLSLALGRCAFLCEVRDFIKTNPGEYGSKEILYYVLKREPSEDELNNIKDRLVL